MKRRFLCLFLVLSLLTGLLLTSCANSDTPVSTETEGTVSTADGTGEITSNPPSSTDTEEAPSDTNPSDSTDTPSDTLTDATEEESDPTETVLPSETDSDVPSSTETDTEEIPTEEPGTDEEPTEEPGTDEEPTEETPTDPPAQTESGSPEGDPASGSFGAYKHVVVVGVDGGGDFLHDEITLPQISSIFGSGAVTYTAQTSHPSISAQCWGSLLHGVTPAKHKLNNSSAGQNPYPNNSPYPSIFRMIRAASPDADLASFCAWGTINKGIVEDNIGVHKVSGGGDTNITSGAAAYFKENLPTFMFVQLNDVDVALHGYGFESNECILAIRRSDVRIGEIWRAIQASGVAEDTLFIVTADHGGNGTDHGGFSAGEMNILFAVAGRTVQNGTIGEMEIQDTASIVLYALGIDPSANWTSRVPSGLFEGVEASARPVYGTIPAHRTQASTKTPAANSGAYVTDFVDNEVNVYLQLDGTTADATQTVKTTEHGTLSYTDGIFGSAVCLDKGYISLGNYALGADSFSVAFWFNTNGNGSDPAILSNKDWSWENGYAKFDKPGFTLSIRDSHDLQFSFADGTTKVNAERALPISYDDGWMYVVLSVDRAKGTIGISIDFSAFTVTAIPAALLGASVDSLLPLNIGQDGMGDGSKLPGLMDEFIIFDGALDAEDVKALASYYGIKE